MGKDEGSLLMFLSMEKRQDVESCCDEKRQEVKEQSAVEVFWICVVATLLVLSLVSGACQFFDHGHHEDLEPLQPPLHVEFLPLYEVPLRNSGSEVLDGFFTEPRFSDPVSPRDEYQGEAVVHDGRAYLTAQHSADEKGVVARPHSVGRLLHSQVLRMKHRGPKPGEVTVASFQVTFVFSIENSIAGREATGDGFAFVMVPEGNAMGSAGGSLGVLDLDNGETAHHTFAVEFDTWKNPSLHDINNNHVGINVNSMVSVVAEEAGYWPASGNDGHAHEFRPLDLTSGKIQAWIDYDGMSREVTVRISPALGRKPEKPLLKSSIDLSKVLNEYMSVGFSAATGDFAAKHVIHSWQFEESSTLQHWRSANDVLHDEVSVLSADSEVSRQSRVFQTAGLPRDHVSNLPLFRNPPSHRRGDMTTAAVFTVLPASSEVVEIRPLNAMRKICAGYLPDLPTMALATFKKHLVLNSLWVMLGLATALLLIHLLFIAYNIVAGCYNTCVGHSDEPLRMAYSRVFDQSGEDTQEARYILVVSEGQQHQRPQS